MSSILERHQTLNSLICAGGQIEVFEAKRNIAGMIQAHRDREELLGLLGEMELHREAEPLPPTADGWYYGRRRHSDLATIHPYRVRSEFVVLTGGDLATSWFDWFGPVPTCREGGT